MYKGTIIFIAAVNIFLCYQLVARSIQLKKSRQETIDQMQSHLETQRKFMSFIAKTTLREHHIANVFGVDGRLILALLEGKRPDYIGALSDERDKKIDSLFKCEIPVK